MLKKTKDIIRSILSVYPKYLCKKEYINNEYTFNERPIEFGFVFKHLSKIYPDKILDVGTGTTALPHLMYNCGFNVTAIDNISDYWSSGMFNRHYHVIDDDITSTKLTKKYDLITCVSVLEHIEKADDAMRCMFELLKSGGYLILTCPYTEKEYFNNVYSLPDSKSNKNISYVCQSFSRKTVDNWLRLNNVSIIEQEYWRIFDGACWTIGNEEYPPEKTDREELHQLTCILFRKL